MEIVAMLRRATLLGVAWPLFFVCLEKINGGLDKDVCVCVCGFGHKRKKKRATYSTNFELFSHLYPFFFFFGPARGPLPQVPLSQHNIVCTRLFQNLLENSLVEAVFASGLKT